MPYIERQMGTAVALNNQMVTSEGSFEQGLSKNALRRLIISFILHEQKKRQRQGLIRSDQALAARLAGRDADAIDDIEINEDMLGFDSLGILELILAMNRFFDLARSGVEDYLLINRRIGSWADLLSQHRMLVGPDWTFGFTTSGSTGNPSLVSHTAHDLWEEMEAQIAGPLSHVESPGRILLLVPPHHIYGFLFGCVLPDLLGMDVVDLYSAGPATPFRLAQEGDVIVGTPFNWDLLRRTDLKFAEGVYGVTSAGPSTPETWQCVQTNNLARLTEIYGSTETGGVGSRSGYGHPFDLLPHLNGTDGTITRRSATKPLVLQDKLDWSDARSFRVVGRLDTVVQVAGVNVSTTYVRDHILGIEGVADVAVRMGDDRLRAFLVPEAGVDCGTLQDNIQANIQAALDPPARPHSFTFGPQLPRNDMGKTADWM